MDIVQEGECLNRSRAAHRPSCEDIKKGKERKGIRWKVENTSHHERGGLGVNIVSKKRKYRESG